MAQSTQGTGRIHIEAPAKVNLFLEVTGRREDGYHDLESIFQAVSLCDSLKVSLSDGSGIDLNCNVKALETPSNLAVCAAEAYLSAAGVEGKVTIDLQKHIPCEAGLGGGSSDAAAVLVALNRLSSSPLSNCELRELGATIGSDVPFFIEGGTALVRGRGEKVEHFDIRGILYFVILYPGFGMSTGAVYKNLTLKLTQKRDTAKVLWDLMSQGELETSKKRFFNRLEEAAFELDARLARTKKAMQQMVGDSAVLLCGSGASLFSAFADKNRALRAFEALRDAKLGEIYLAESIMRRLFSESAKGVSGGDF